MCSRSENQVKLSTIQAQESKVPCSKTAINKMIKSGIKLFIRISHVNHQFFRSTTEQNLVTCFTLVFVCIYIYTHVHSLSTYCPREGTLSKPLFGYEHNLTFQIQHYPQNSCAQEMSPTQKFPSPRIFSMHVSIAVLSFI